MSKLPEPVKVSPLIKLFRYSFLVAGVVYGASRKKALQIKEASVREERERLKAEKEAKVLAEKKAASDRDIANLVSIFVPETKPKFEVKEQEYKGERTHTNEDVGSCKIEEVMSTELSEGIQQEKQCLRNVEFDDNQNIGDNIEQDGIFSKSINLSGSEDSTSKVKENIAISVSDDPNSTTENSEQNDANGYFIESFTGGALYVTPEERSETFYPPEEKSE